jgi:hypothetical protein
MSIDFISAPCTRVNSNCQRPSILCQSSTTSVKFGICDKEPPPSLPAYIDTTNPVDWIAEVQNPRGINLIFKAIDACVEITRLDGNAESRCDGVLINDTELTFVELKNRVASGWLSKGRKQLTITIQKFLSDGNAGYTIKDAYVCNKQRPLAITSNTNEIQKFKDDTGLDLKISRIITI